MVVLWTDDCINYNTHASLWDDGKWTSLDFVDPNCPDAGTGFESFNNRHRIRGLLELYVQLRHRRRHQREDGQVVQSFPANWDVSAFWAGSLFINDSGRIAGQNVENSTSSPKYDRLRGYVQDGSGVTTFDAPGEPSMDTYVNGITSSGYVLLIGCNPYPACTNFSWRRGVFTPLPNVPFSDAVETDVFGLSWLRWVFDSMDATICNLRNGPVLEHPPRPKVFGMRQNS